MLNRMETEFSEEESNWDSEAEEYKPALQAQQYTGAPPSATFENSGPPTAPPRVETNQEYDDEYYEEDDEDGFYEDEGEYYEDEDGEEYYEEGEEYYEDGEEVEYYDDEEFDDEEGEEYYDDDEYYDDEEYYDEEGGEYYDDEEEDVGFDDGFEEDTEGWDVAEPQESGMFSKITNATSNAFSAVRKSLGKSKNNGGYVAPTLDALKTYETEKNPLKIERNPTPLDERIPQSMRAPKKVDFGKIKGNLKGVGPTKRPLTGLHQPVPAPQNLDRAPKDNGGKVAQKSAIGKAGPSYVKASEARFKRTNAAPSYAARRAKLKEAPTNRPLTGYFRPMGNDSTTGEKATNAVEEFVPQKKNKNQGIEKDFGKGGSAFVKAEKPRFKKDPYAPDIVNRRKGLKKVSASQQRPLTGYYQAVNGPKGEASSAMVEGFEPKKKNPKSVRANPKSVRRNPNSVRRSKKGPPTGRGGGPGYVKASKANYSRRNEAPQLINARGKLKKGSSKRPLTGYYQPVGGKKINDDQSTNIVNGFVPKEKGGKKKGALDKML